MVLQQAPVEFFGTWLEDVITDPGVGVVTEPDSATLGSKPVTAPYLMVSQTSASVFAANVSGAGRSVPSGPG
jgi:hypothetical protein